MKSQNNIIAGLYCRLSRDDNNGNLVSMSIENQQQFLLDYAEEKGWSVYSVYVDDGYSGTNFDRPDFKRMLKDAEAGRINCVITKDLSRLGRNYVQAGHYTEEYFVEHDVRFIAVNDGVDNMKEDDGMAAFHHVINEFYPRQVSKKVRQVKAACARQGKFMGSQAPFGYKKSPEDKHQLIIDMEAVSIVQRMFREFAAGDSGRMIADRFNAEGIDSPRFYHYRQLGRENPIASEKNVWGSCTVLQILRNQVYIGNMVQGKRQVVSFKTKKRREIDPEDWIVVENTHEPIIDRDTWDRVHSRLGRKEKARRTKSNTVGLFAGKIFCTDCESPLAYMRKPLKGGEKGVYRCSRYNNNGRKACTPHYIDESYLTAFVLNDIRLYARLAVAERDRLEKRLLREMAACRNAESKALLAQKREIENRLSGIASHMKSTYVDKCNGKISEDMAFRLMDDFSREQHELEETLESLEQQIVAVQQAEGEIADWMALIGQQLNIEALDRATVMELIDRIDVSDARDENGVRSQDVSIQYRFIGNMLVNGEEGIA